MGIKRLIPCLRPMKARSSPRAQAAPQAAPKHAHLQKKLYLVSKCTRRVPKEYTLCTFFDSNETLRGFSGPHTNPEAGQKPAFFFLGKRGICASHQNTNARTPTTAHPKLDGTQGSPHGTESHRAFSLTLPGHLVLSALGIDSAQNEIWACFGPFEFRQRHTRIVGSRGRRRTSFRVGSAFPFRENAGNFPGLHRQSSGRFVSCRDPRRLTNGCARLQRL